MVELSDARFVPLRDSLVGRALRGSDNVTYYLRECIGEGGQGWVFRANWDDPSGHVVIVKVLRPDVIATEALRRFQREAHVLRMLSTQGRPNPYIVRFYDHAVAQVPSPFGGEPLTLPFTVLEHVDGTTLEKVLLDHKGQGMPAERVRRLLRQISQALELVHAQKVVHRDLKPSNILLAMESGTEIAKVTDFGLVKLVDVNLQKTTALAGASLGYAPPEQYEAGNKRVSPRTDVFSLAAVVFEMLTGKVAFPFNEGENPLLIVTRILTHPRPTLMKVHGSMAPEIASSQAVVAALDRELMKALNADPLGRHESVKEFWNAIEPALRAATEERPAPVRERVSPFQATAAMQSDARISVPPPVNVASASSRPAPDAWSFSRITLPIGPRSLRWAAFSPNGAAAIALSSSGLLRWDRGSWMPATLPAHIPRGAIRGLRMLPDGGTLLFGEGGFVAKVMPNGTVGIYRVPDPEITFLGALVEAHGTTTLVGERPYRGSAARSVSGRTAGVVTQFNGDRLAVVGDAIHATRLRSVARLARNQLVACGDWGSLVRIELGAVEHVGALCEGHLGAIAPLPDGGAVTVGVKGHALSLSPNLEGHLEVVKTTRDLLSLTTTEEGIAFAGCADARILCRVDRTWLRIDHNDALNVTSNIIALSATNRMVRAIGDDGSVVEGRA